MISTSYTLILVAAAAVVTLLLRALPFLVFNGKREMPVFVKRVTDSLPPAIMAALVVYCLKDSLTSFGTGTWASLIAVACVVGVHLWKKNTLLSIAVGTAVYMILIRVM